MSSSPTLITAWVKRLLPPWTERISRTEALPRDVLDQIVTTSVAEYVVYTNVDIGVMPHFYAAIRRHIASGYDAIVINRRTIPATPHSPEDLPMMYSAIGKPHPGYDCFVFRRDAYPQFVLGDVCLGSGHVDTPLICSMIATSHKFLLLTDSHLTFHLGDSRTWMRSGLRDYRRHNDREAINSIRTLALHAPRSMSILLRMALRLRLIKNRFVTAEFRRMFSR